MIALIEAIHELAESVKVGRAARNTPSPCDSCKAPAIEARFRLMEAAYHEDMNEVYKRLRRLESGDA